MEEEEEEEEGEGEEDLGGETVGDWDAGKASASAGGCRPTVSAVERGCRVAAAGDGSSRKALAGKGEDSGNACRDPDEAFADEAGEPCKAAKAPASSLERSTGTTGGLQLQ